MTDRKSWKRFDDSKRFNSLLIFLLSLSFAYIFFILARPAFLGQVYLFDDLGWSHMPFRYFYSRALASGDNFLWAPTFHCGFYIHGDGLVGMTHPLHYLLYRYLPLTWAFNLEFLLSYPAMFAGMYYMLRRWKLPRHAAMLGAMSFTFGGFNLMHFMHINAIAVLAHMPWLVAMADILLTTDNPRELAAAQAGIAILTGSQWLLGYPQYVLFSSIAETSFVVWKTWGDKSRSRLWWWILAKATGGMIGMVQILPTWESLKASLRRNPTLAFTSSYSVHPFNLIQLWSPFALRGHVYGDNAHELGIYCGSFNTVVLAWPFIGGKNAAERWKPLMRAAAVFAGLTFFLALGRYGLIYPLIARLPLIGLFRGPARYIVLTQWAISILAAIAFAELSAISARSERFAWSALRPIFILAMISLLIAAAIVWLLECPAPAGWPVILRAETFSNIRLVLAGTGLSLAAMSLAILAARGFKWSLVGLIILLTIDIMSWGMNYLRYPWSDSWNKFIHPPPMSIEAYLKTIPEPPDALSGRLAFPNDWSWINVLTVKGYSLVDGYVALKPAKTLDVHSETYRRLANARWAVILGHWKRVPDPMPRVRMVAHAIAMPGPDADTDRLDISKEAWTDPPVELKPSKPGSAQIVVDRPGLIDIAVLSSSRQLLILSESYHPGWQAAADGRPVPVLRAYGNFIACLVDPGSHKIEFQFLPSSFVWGMRLSIAGLIVLACTIAALLLPEYF